MTAVLCGSDSCSKGLHSAFLYMVFPCTVDEASPEGTVSIHISGAALREQGEMGQPEWWNKFCGSSTTILKQLIILMWVGK